ncbi:hypothetical protein JW960_29090 [candidate division KSB1 bacterium]|nr:hypothetical protein [candidate division KSB1 bacterium]
MNEHKHSPNCHKTMALICDDLGENIDSDFCKEIQEHLEQCPQCCASVNSYRKTVHLYKLYCNEDVPQAIDQRLWKILQISKPE